MTCWDLSPLETARAFWVSRQVFSAWLRDGVLTGRTSAVADLESATSLLAAPGDRIESRGCSALGDRSLYEVARDGKHDEVVEAVKWMVDLRKVQP